MNVHNFVQKHLQIKTQTSRSTGLRMSALKESMNGRKTTKGHDSKESNNKGSIYKGTFPLAKIH